jgi:hypothetical protein
MTELLELCNNSFKSNTIKMLQRAIINTVTTKKSLCKNIEEMKKQNVNFKIEKIQ